MAPLRDKVIIVTGASEGIGRALCLALAEQRPRLVVAARNRDRLDTLRVELERSGVETLVQAVDLTRMEDCRALIAAAADRWGAVDVLVNNAGRTMWSLLEELRDPGILESLMRVNYLGAAWCTYFALPHLMRSRGRIVAVSSVAGLNGVPTRSGYAASKHALFGFFNSLRIELQASGVTVTMVAPDFVLSEIHRRAFGPEGTPLGHSPLQAGRVMSAETCARLMVDAMVRRRRLLITSRRGRIGRILSLLAPALVDRIAARAIRQKH
jgi:short-subunit dehydrogenase